MTIRCKSEEKIEITNFKVIKTMSLNEFTHFLLADEKMITLKNFTWNNRENVYNWLTSIYDESDPIWKEMRHIWEEVKK